MLHAVKINDKSFIRFLKGLPILLLLFHFSYIAISLGKKEKMNNVTNVDRLMQELNVEQLIQIQSSLKFVLLCLWINKFYSDIRWSINARNCVRWSEGVIVTF